MSLLIEAWGVIAIVLIMISTLLVAFYFDKIDDFWRSYSEFMIVRWKHKRGYKELVDMVGKKCAKWTIIHLANSHKNYNIEYMPEESFDDVVSVYSIIISNFIIDPDKYMFLHDYQDSIKSNYTMYQEFVENEESVEKYAYWRSRHKIVESMWKDFIVIYSKGHKRNGRDIIKERTNEELMYINNLKDYRKRTSGFE